MPLRLLLLLASLAPLAVLRASNAGRPLAAFQQVEVAPAKTSIYVGTVSMTMPPFTRTGEGYTSTYAAKVFPYFFYNESGTLRIEFTEAMLRQLERGEPVDFTGRAEKSTDRAERRIEGRATPTDATSGKLKVRVFYSRRVALIFNTTYRFQPVATGADPVVRDESRTID